MREDRVSIRLAKLDDFEFFYDLKSEDFNIFWAGGSGKPERDNLKKFFYDAVEHADDVEKRKIYIIENNAGEKVGHLYIIPSGSEFELATAIMKSYCGRGYAKKSIRLGLEEGKRLGFTRMVTKIREDNTASLKAYTSCGVEILKEYEDVYIPYLKKNVKMFVAKMEL